MAEADHEEEFVDYYEVLDVAWDASEEETKRAYRRRAREWHPDTNPGSGTDERFKLLGEAMEVLGDPDKRRVYDTPQRMFDPHEVDFGDVYRGSKDQLVTVRLRNVGRYIPDVDAEARRNFGDFWDGTSYKPIAALHVLGELYVALKVPSDFDLGPKKDCLSIEFQGEEVLLAITINIVEAVLSADSSGSGGGGGSAPSGTRRSGRPAARDRFRKADSDRRRARTGGRPSSPRPARKTPKRPSAAKAAPVKAVRPSFSSKYRTRTAGRVIKDAYQIALAYAVTVAVLGGFVGLVVFAFAGSIITKMHPVPGGPTPTQLNLAQGVGALGFVIFAVYWYSAAWRIKYHRRVSETWRSGPLGRGSTIGLLILTTLGTILLFPLILAGIALGMIQYD